jgi:phosphoribosylglycinamide formyltransferase-1
MKFAILGSGRGSNARVLLQAWRAGRLGKATPTAIFCDQPDAPILGLGAQFGIPAHQLDCGGYKTRLSAEAEARWCAAIADSGADWVVLAGFMRVIKSTFLERFPMRIINLHPSLLPAFKGLDAIGQALDYGVKYTGCTVHFVTAALDGGPIIDQAVVPVLPGDSKDSLAARVHAAEHQLLPDVITRLAAETEL